MPDLSPAAIRTALSRRPNQIAIGVVAVVTCYRYLVWLFYMRHIPLTGDEQFYHRGASILTRFLRGVAENETVLQRIVERGWFMPGTTLHILPARRWTGDLGLIRLWMGGFDLILLVIAAAVIARVFGRRIAVPFLAYVGLNPDTATQSFSLWGESHGSKVLIIALCLLALIVRDCSVLGRAAIGARAAAVGWLLAWAIYLRPSLLLQLGTAIVAVVVLIAGRVDRPDWRRTAIVAAAIPVTALIIISPWTAAVSNESGGFVLTTNTVNVNLIHAFSDPEDVRAFAGGTTFAEIESALRARMERTGESYVEVLTNVRREFMGNVSLGEYLERADREVESFLDPDETFLERYNLILADGSTARPRAMIDAQFDLLVVVHQVLWWPLVAATLYAFLRRFPLTEHAGFVAVIAKVALSAALVQPWLSNAKFRHLGAVIPLMVLLSLLALVRDRDAPDERRDYRRWARLLGTEVQVVAAAIVIISTIAYLS